MRRPLPRASFVHYYVVLALGMFVVQGIGHVISVGVDPNKSILLSVVLVLIQNFLNGFQRTLTSMTGVVPRDGHRLGGLDGQVRCGRAMCRAVAYPRGDRRARLERRGADVPKPGVGAHDDGGVRHRAGPAQDAERTARLQTRLFAALQVGAEVDAALCERVQSVRRLKSTRQLLSIVTPEEAGEMALRRLICGAARQQILRAEAESRTRPRSIWSCAGAAEDDEKRETVVAGTYGRTAP